MKNLDNYYPYEKDRIIKETSKAYLIEMNNGGKEWFPKSQCTLLNDLLYVPQWLLDRKFNNEYEEI